MILIYCFLNFFNFQIQKVYTYVLLKFYIHLAYFQIYIHWL